MRYSLWNISMFCSSFQYFKLPLTDSSAVIVLSANHMATKFYKVYITLPDRIAPSLPQECPPFSTGFTAEKQWWASTSKSTIIMNTVPIYYVIGQLSNIFFSWYKICIASYYIKLVSLWKLVLLCSVGIHDTCRNSIQIPVYHLDWLM